MAQFGDGHVQSSKQIRGKEAKCARVNESVRDGGRMWVESFVTMDLRKRVRRMLALTVPIVIAFACRAHRPSAELESDRWYGRSRDVGVCRSLPGPIHVYLIGDSTM